MFSVHVNASLKFLWALWGLSEGTQALGHSEGTWALGGHSKGTPVLGHLSHSGTRVLRALRHWGTWALGQSGTSALRALGHSSSQATWALELSSHSGTRGTLFRQTGLYENCKVPSFRKLNCKRWNLRVIFWLHLLFLFVLIL